MRFLPYFAKFYSIFSLIVLQPKFQGAAAPPLTPIPHGRSPWPELESRPKFLRPRRDRDLNVPRLRL